MRKVALSLLFIALVSSCQVLELVGLSTKPYIGTWRANVIFSTVTWDIRAGGTIVVSSTTASGTTTTSGTWGESGGRLTVTTSGTASIFLYAMGSGNATMTITPESGGLSFVFVKQ